jgi:hypothetical protein
MSVRDGSGVITKPDIRSVARDRSVVDGAI